VRSRNVTLVRVDDDDMPTTCADAWNA